MRKNLLLAMAIVLGITNTVYGIDKKANNNKKVLSGLSIERMTESKFVEVGKDVKLIPASEPISYVAAAKPAVSYKVPQGTLFYGLSNDFYALTSVYGIASPYCKWTFKNTSSGAPTFKWALNEYSSATNTYVATTKTLDTSGGNLSLNVTTEGFTFPTLTGTENGQDSVFTFAKNYASKANTGYIDAGGSSYDNGTRVFNLSNWCKDLSQTSWKFADNDFAFGTGKSSIDAVVAYYEKPQSTLYFEGANFFLGTYSAPETAIFTLRIITVDMANGYPQMKDTIATSHITGKEVISASATAFVMPFSKLVAIDKDGLENEIKYVELDDAFVLELSWTNATDVKLAVRSSYYDGLLSAPLPYYDNHAFIYAPYASNGGKRTLLKYSWPATLNTSLTNAAYTYLVSATDTINAKTTAGTETFTLVPFYSGVWLDEDAPSWITLTENEHYVSGNWGTDITINYQALPAGTAYRSADLVFKTWGAKKIVHVKQGIPTGTTSLVNQRINVAKSSNSFEVTKADNYTSVSLLNVSGQLIGKYPISQSAVSIPTSALTNGVYVLKFEGNGSEIIKVIK